MVYPGHSNEQGEVSAPCGMFCGTVTVTVKGLESGVIVRVIVGCPVDTQRLESWGQAFVVLQGSCRGAAMACKWHSCGVAMLQQCHS
jgi:hypothetical protein